MPGKQATHKKSALTEQQQELPSQKQALPKEQHKNTHQDDPRLPRVSGSDTHGMWRQRPPRCGPESPTLFSSDITLRPRTVRFASILLAVIATGRYLHTLSLTPQLCSGEGDPRTARWRVLPQSSCICTQAAWLYLTPYSTSKHAARLSSSVPYTIRS